MSPESYIHSSVLPKPSVKIAVPAQATLHHTQKCRKKKVSLCPRVTLNLYNGLTCAREIVGERPSWSKLQDQAWKEGWDMGHTSTTNPTPSHAQFHHYLPSHWTLLPLHCSAQHLPALAGANRKRSAHTEVCRIRPSDCANTTAVKLLPPNLVQSI